MATVLTLHQGDEKADYVPHPMEVARRALMDAARDEEPALALALRRFAVGLPPRGPIRKGDD